MANVVDYILDTVDSVLAWLGSSLRQNTAAYCDLETADSRHTLVSHDGALISVLRLHGANTLVGPEEFERIHSGLCQSLQTTMGQPGHTLQVYFSYDEDAVKSELTDILNPAKQTAARLDLDLQDLFQERVNHLSDYCAHETLFLVLWTRPNSLTKEQYKRSLKEKSRFLTENKVPPLKNTQNLLAAFPELRNAHDSFVRSVLNDLNSVNLYTSLLDIHTAVYEMRRSVDPEFTDKKWRPVLPGDKVPARQSPKPSGDIADLLLPPLSKQVIPRDGHILDLRTARIGDRDYASVFIDLFPKDIKPFSELFARVSATRIPWRISFLIDSRGLNSIKMKGLLAAILSFTSANNRLISDAKNLLADIDVNSDDAVVKLQVVTTTWAPEGELSLLRNRTSELAKAIEGWGSCEVSEVCGDPFEGVISSTMGICGDNVATASVAPLSDVIYMLPITRPASVWPTGAVLFRSPDGKPWPYQPGSTEQTTWIDIIYARPGSGKSVLSNALNLALCLSSGLVRLPRIAIVDIGPSSSGLISLLREALPHDKQHLVAYHRLQMTPEYAINPFDTQLGCRYPTPQERAFLVNFLTLLATPMGQMRTYDGITDMAGMVVDSLYKIFADEGNPTAYTAGIELIVDGILDEIGFVFDQHTTWWEVTDALFTAGFTHEAMLAQRYAMPLLADAASICRTSAIEDLYGKINTPTGEPLINAFSRMISSAVREYPILSRLTCFDISDARVVSLDLDEVAKSGGEAADRQTAVMYMLARYVLARHYYLTEENTANMPNQYRHYHVDRVSEIREDPKRIVFDEFHRTSKAQAVRDQVILDMREGRKWKVQIGLLSQSLDDFDDIMVEFATSIFIMDAGPAQAIAKTTQVFGLSETAQLALKHRVHGPREGGATFLAQFATKHGMNTQLLTNTIGPVELWAFSTTVEDVRVRDKLYQQLGPKEARRVLANLFPSGSLAKVVEERMARLKEQTGVLEENADLSIIEQLVQDILQAYAKDPDVKFLRT